jgi:hypothetical protein
MVQNQTNIKCLQNENVKEYKSNEFKFFLPRKHNSKFFLPLFIPFSKMEFSKGKTKPSLEQC